MMQSVRDCLARFNSRSPLCRNPQIPRMGMALPSFKILLFHLAVTIFCRSSSYRQQAVSVRVRSATRSIQSHLHISSTIILFLIVREKKDTEKTGYTNILFVEDYPPWFIRFKNYHENETVNLDDLIHWFDNIIIMRA